MADPDCDLCAMAGYRSCDSCGGVVFKPLSTAFGLIDVCGYCR